MPKISGEAVHDSNHKKWCFVIRTDEGRTLFKSDTVFENQQAAETELIEIIQGLSESVHDFGQGG
ncbi:MAG TPA: hypothetical protein VLB90_03215 [Pseudomonadales bacterium]|nr:hypothetical protein [Pseudomonadales bacterium]